MIFISNKTARGPGREGGGGDASETGGEGRVETSNRDVESVSERAKCGQTANRWRAGQRVQGSNECKA